MANDLTFLECVQAVCYELGLNAPSAVIGSQDLQTLQFHRLFYREGQDLYRSRNWTFLSGEHIINLAAPITITADTVEGSAELTNCSDWLFSGLRRVRRWNAKRAAGHVRAFRDNDPAADGGHGNVCRRNLLDHAGHLHDPIGL
jgi:hypothetical protein